MTKKKKTLKEKQKHGKKPGTPQESKILIDETSPESLALLERVHWRDKNKLTPYK